MTRDQLRAWLRERVRTGEGEFEEVWSLLEGKRVLSEYDQGLISEAEVLYEAAEVASVFHRMVLSWKDTLRYLPPERPDRRIPEEVSVELDGYTRRRAETGSEVAAAFADGHPAVKEFREKHLGGEDIRLTETEARELLEEDMPSEMLGDLMQLGRNLGWRYRWTYRDTWWFVLTGDAPYVQPLRVHYDYVEDEPHYPNMAQLTLIVEPWVDATDVERVYRSVQRQILGGDNRKKDERTLEAVRFAAREMRRENVSWTELLRRWNGAQPDPERRYKSRSGLPQAFNRFSRAIYHSPAIKPLRELPGVLRFDAD